MKEQAVLSQVWVQDIVTVLLGSIGHFQNILDSDNVSKSNKCEIDGIFELSPFMGKWII